MKKAISLLIILLLAACSGQDKNGDQAKAPDNNDPGTRVSLEFRIAEDQPGEGLIESVFAESGETFYLHAQPIFNEAAVDSAYLLRGGASPLIGIIINKEAAARFEKITGENIGKRAAILVDGKIVSIPMIRAAIPGGRAMLNGDFSQEETERILKSLNKK